MTLSLCRQAFSIDEFSKNSSSLSQVQLPVATLLVKDSNNKVKKLNSLPGSHFVFINLFQHLQGWTLFSFCTVVCPFGLWREWMFGDFSVCCLGPSLFRDRGDTKSVHEARTSSVPCLWGRITICSVKLLSLLQGILFLLTKASQIPHLEDCNLGMKKKWDYYK